MFPFRRYFANGSSLTTTLLFAGGIGDFDFSMYFHFVLSDSSGRIHILRWREIFLTKFSHTPSAITCRVVPRGGDRRRPRRRCRRADCAFPPRTRRRTSCVSAHTCPPMSGLLQLAGDFPTRRGADRARPSRR